MSIRFACPCGMALQVKDEFAGRQSRCPVCGRVSIIGAIELPDEVIEELPPPVLAPPAAPIRANPVRGREEYDRRSSDHSDDEDRNTLAESNEPRRRPRRSTAEDPHAPRRRFRARRALSPENIGLRVLYLLGGLALAAVGLVLVVLGWMSQGQGGPRALVAGVCLVFCGFGATIQGIIGNFSLKEHDGSDLSVGPRAEGG